MLFDYINSQNYSYKYMISHARLLFSIPLIAFQKEVSAIDQTWQPHFNIQQYEGNWSVLSLRSPGGKSDGIIPDKRGGEGFANTPIFDQCPGIQHWLEMLQCPVMAVRLLKLQAGASIKEHRDHELSFEQGEARLHIPVFTNKEVWFYIDDEAMQMQEGECWYMNANLRHRVVNKGHTDRIHLVIDCLVNDWLTDRFREAQKTEANNIGYIQQQEKIIDELRRQQLPAANAIADEMEKKIKELSAGK